jgi:hypothetical protein
LLRVLDPFFQKIKVELQQSPAFDWAIRMPFSLMREIAVKRLGKSPPMQWLCWKFEPNLADRALGEP